jgi:PLP dependent protein
MSLSARLRGVQDRVSRACEVAGRDPGAVTLIAVSKTFGIDDVRLAYDLGLRHFGESRLQEAIPKIEALPEDIIWHFIGGLQSNKAKKIAQEFSVVHTLCKEAQLREIAKSGHHIEGFVEVNIAAEPQKGGIFCKELDDFMPTLLQCEQVRFRGLMTIGPAVDDPEAMRPYFKALRRENERAGGQWLSMGMSNDFEVAIQEGATHIRIGSALFGAR